MGIVRWRRLYLKTRQSLLDARPGLYFVTHNPPQERAMIDAGSLRDEFERAARSGKKIHDKRDPHEQPRPETKTTLWQPPSPERW